MSMVNDDLVTKKDLEQGFKATRREFKKDIKRLEDKIIDKLNLIIKVFDRTDLDHEARIKKIEKNLGIVNVGTN